MAEDRFLDQDSVENVPGTSRGWFSSWNNVRLANGALLLLIVSGLILLLDLTIGRIGWEASHTIAAEDIRHESGYCYLVRVKPPGFLLQLIDQEEPENNSGVARLFENGGQIGPGRSYHDDIRKNGAGRFALDGSNLRFSAQDSGDPRVNQKRYQLTAKVAVNHWLVKAAYLGLTLGLLGLLWSKWGMLALSWLLQHSQTAGRTLMVLAAGVTLITIIVNSAGWEMSAPLEPKEIKGEIGFAYTGAISVAIPGFRFLDDAEDSAGSNVYRLLENGQRLAWGRADHQAIRQVGLGRFSLWRDTIYFSTSDNSDPRTNGRTYTLVARIMAAQGITLIGVLGFCLGALLFVLKLPEGQDGWKQRWDAARQVWLAPVDWGVKPEFSPLVTFALVAFGGVLFVAALFWSPPGWLPLPASSLMQVLLWTGGGALIGGAMLGARARQNDDGRYRVLRRFLACSLPILGLLLFAVPLLARWLTGITTYDAIGGLLSYSDAKGYFEGGLQLLNDGILSSWSTRRPLNAVLHALRFDAVGGDLRKSLALAALSAGLASLVLACELRRSLGSLAAGVAFGLLALYCAPYLYTTLSEVHGFTLGVLAMAVLWRSATERKPALFGLGMALLSLALSARAGTFFVLPFLLLWATLRFEPQKRISWPALAFGVGGITFGLGLPLLFIRLWAEGSGGFQANFAYTLYGMAAGGGGWKQINLDHPEIFHLPTERDQANATYRLALQLILENPLPFIKFYLREIGRFFVFAASIVHFPGLKLSKILAVLLAIGSVTALLRLRDGCCGLLLAMLLGVVLSSPFLITDGGERVFAATAPAIIMLSVVGLATAIRLLAAVATGLAAPAANPGGDRSGPGGLWRTPLSVIVAVAVLLVVTVGPLAVIPLRAKPLKGVAACPNGQPTIVTTPGVTSALITIAPDDWRLPTSVPTIRAADFFTYGDNLRQLEMSPAFLSLRPPFSIVLAYNQAWRIGQTFEGVFAIIEGEAPLLAQSQRLRLCADPTPPGGLEELKGWVYKIRSLETAPAP